VLIRDSARSKPTRTVRGAAAVALTTCALAASGCTTGDKAGKQGPGSDKGTMTITLWNNIPAVDAVKELSAGFEKKHPGVKVNVRYAPNPNNAYDTMVTGLLAANSVDIVGRFAQTPDQYPDKATGIQPTGEAARIAAGQEADVTDQPFMSRLDKSQQSFAAGYGNRIYGVLADQFVAYPCVFYKKSLFQKYGLAVPDTYSELLSTLKTFQGHGLTPLMVPGKDGYQDFIRAGIIDRALMKGKPSSAAAQVGNQRAQEFWSGKQTWNDPFYHSAYQQYVQVMKYSEKNAAGVASATAVGSWAANTGDYPMYLTGSWDGPVITKANPKLDFGFFCMPTSDSAAENRLILSPDLIWTVPKNAPHRKLAMEWLDYFTQPSNYQIWLQKTGAYPTVNGTKPATQSWTDWLSAHGGGAFEHVIGPWIPNGAPADAAGPDELQMVPLGDQSVDAALRKAASDYARARGHA
jgi:raffinose/stachyose/melibiose transport system substrate-binding protein